MTTRAPLRFLGLLLALTPVLTPLPAFARTEAQSVPPAASSDAPPDPFPPAVPADPPWINGLPPRIFNALRGQRVPRTAVSVVVRDTATGEVLLEHNADVARSPASTMKVVSAYAALSELGPNYTWTTRAWATGPVSGGRLRGDLVLQGGGDPTLSIERWWRFVQELRARGLESIEGDILVDNTHFALAEVEPNDFDGRGFKTYNVIPDALLVHEHAATITVAPGADGARITVDPMPDNLRIVNRVRISRSHCRSGASMLRFGGPGDGATQLTVGGHLSRRCGPARFERVIMKPAEFAYGTFVTLWRQAGGKFEGRMRLESKPAGSRLLLEFGSLPLATAVYELLKHSSNPMTRTLILTLGAERYGTPATVQDGEQVVHDFLVDRGLVFPELVIDNGSGLSRITRISASSMAQMLMDAARSPYAAEFQAGLPLGGQDGTLRRRFTETEEGRVRMKTGTLNGVSALAGYVRSSSGRLLSVVSIVNHPGAQSGPGIVVNDAVVRWALAQP
ncbi:MAG: D-alanyl-D-alanine carboxypeptidase/D-alanyl-D-alanine-endopeptidase [Gammaproteobacteria bacterium]